MTRDQFDRRRFITASATATASLLIGCPEEASSEAGRPQPTQDAHGGHSSPEATTSSGRCAPTTKDITGPFWREGIPIRNHFDVHGHAGTPLMLSGVVRDGTCKPIAKAVIEMWHAAPTVKTAKSLTPGDSVAYDTMSPVFRYYGQFATNERGEYKLSTKKPGWYLNGPTFRPSHIHARIYVQGTIRLTTQLYFKGDPFILNDPWASRAPDRTVALTSTSNGGLMGAFDFTVS